MFARSIKALLAVLCLTLAVSTPSFAGVEAVDFVKNEQANLAALLKKPDSAAVRQQVDTVFDRILDYDRLARDSLDKHWDALKDAERAEFKDVLKRLVRNAYRKNLRKTLDYDVKYEGQTTVEDGQIVRTVAKSRVDAREQPISIDYAVHAAGDGRWLIHNIVTEGASLVRSYRNQFSRVIRKDGFDGLMKKMKKKLESEGA